MQTSPLVEAALNQFVRDCVARLRKVEWCLNDARAPGPEGG